MTKKKILSNIIGIAVFLLVDYLIGDNYDFFRSFTRGLVFLALFNAFDYLIRRTKKSKDE